MAQKREFYGAEDGDSWVYDAANDRWGPGSTMAGTYAYDAVAAGGTITVPAGARFISYHAFAKTGDGTVTFAGGEAIPIAEGTGVDKDLRELRKTGPFDVVFSASVEGFVDWVVP
jgi:hypothetical protein